MPERAIRVHAFASVKGGVGKSSLATACAKLLAHQKRRPVLIDCDMTGTSFADGLSLRAPKIQLHTSGGIDFLQPPTGEFETVERTRRLRASRRDALGGEAPLPPPFLNDILRFLDDVVQEQRETDPPRVDALLWCHQQDDGVLYLPSSPLRRDVGESLGWISTHPDRRFDWVHRLTWALHFLVKQREDISDVVLDLPPGIAGLTHETMVLLSKLERGEPLGKGYPPWNEGDIVWRANPFLILTTDRNDMLPGLEYVGQTRNRIRSLLPLVNRADTGVEAIRESAREMLGPTLGALRIEERLALIDEHRPTLGRIFRMGDLPLDPAMLGLARVLRLIGEGS
ncbi:P-loop NTPase [Polyangium aurulentum]|uniref:nucleotide-binding protein n=1 Tax=Polyangium aurulentum TaxID=2567896 RepID=UPI002010067C|nr:P-loop NTPase [Polyangium aurulentum]UQA57778.1 P-loop NTPase [Polyangium aurulentum]